MGEVSRETSSCQPIDDFALQVDAAEVKYQADGIEDDKGAGVRYKD